MLSTHTLYLYISVLLLVLLLVFIILFFKNKKRYKSRLELLKFSINDEKALLKQAYSVIEKQKADYKTLKETTEKKISASQKDFQHNLEQAVIEELRYELIQLLEKEKYILLLSKVISEGFQKKEHDALLKSVKKQSRQLWNNFNLRINFHFKDFHSQLLEKAPKINNTELKICNLLKLNFTSKEIAELLNITEGSLNVTRHRMRKKFDLDRDVNLVEFINSI